MKQRVLIGLFFLLALAACHKPVETRQGTSPQPIASPELSAIDSLMWQRPDSALALLLPCFDTCRDAMLASPTDDADTELETHSMRLYNRHYAHLLLAELLYKNDSAQTNRAELQRSVAYYDSLLQVADTQTIAFLDARAHYINGVGYYERDSIVEACREYLKALEIMEEHFGEKELVGEKARFMALTYTRLTELFSDLYLNQQTIYFGMHSLPYYEKSETSPWHLPWMLSEIGAHYNLIKELDSANYYFQQAKAHLLDTVGQMYRDIVSQQALLLYHMDCQSEKAISDLHRMAVLASSENERLARSLSIGDIYFCEQQFDSAKVYFKQVYDNTKNPNSKMLSTDRLREISLAEGDTLKANGYALDCSQFATEKDKEGHLNSDLTTLCQQYEQGRQETQLMLKIQKAKKRWFIALFLAAFVVAVISLLLLMLRRQMRSQQYSHLMQQAALSGRLRRSNSALKELKTAQEIGSSKNLQQKEVYGKYEDEAICRHILSVCNDKRNSIKSTVPVSAYASIALDDAQKAQLKQAAARHYGELFGKLKKQYPKLKEKDFFYCYLCLLGLDNTQIAAMLQRSSSTIWEREKHLQEIFDSHSKISVFLHEYMMN